MPIPKIIHHIWMGNKKIPNINIYCANSVKQTNKDFKYILWTDNDIEKFKNNFQNIMKNFIIFLE